MGDVYVITRESDGHVIGTGDTRVYANVGTFKKVAFEHVRGGANGLVAGRVDVAEWGSRIHACATGTCGHAL